MNLLTQILRRRIGAEGPLNGRPADTESGEYVHGANLRIDEVEVFFPNSSLLH